MLNLDRRRRLLAGCLLIIAVATLAVTPLLSGCKGKTSGRTARREVEHQDPLASVRDTLRREPQLKECQTAVAQLNLYLRSDEPKPPRLSTGESELLVKKLGLTQAELKEVGQEEFTTLDTHYLEEVFLFHEAVRSLKLDFTEAPATVVDRARLTLAWAMRQVWPLEPQDRALAASSVLRFGFGAVADRGVVALSALQQAGVDAGLVGQAKDARTLRTWAIGVLVGDDVYLFDRRNGRPIAGPGGQGVATLRQVRAAPALAAAQIEVADTGADPKAVVGASRVHLTPPLSALAPRMRWLQTVLRESPPVVLGVDLADLTARFDKAGEKLEFWNPPGDASALTRRLSGSLSPEEGGFAPKDTASLIFARAQALLVPMDQLPAPLRGNAITGEPKLRMLQLFSGRFIELGLQPGRPRDLILRGRFDEATRLLAEARQRTGEQQRRIGAAQNLEAEALKWVDQMLRAAGHLGRAKSNPAANPQDVASAQSAVDNLYKNAQPVELLIEQAIAEPYSAALTYQTALCMHEQAECFSRDPTAPSKVKADAWRNAFGWWSNFTLNHATNPFVKPSQLGHAQQLMAEAKREMEALPQ